MYRFAYPFTIVVSLSGIPFKPSGIYTSSKCSPLYRTSTNIVTSRTIFIPSGTSSVTFGFISALMQRQFFPVSFFSFIVVFFNICSLSGLFSTSLVPASGKRSVLIRSASLAQYYYSFNHIHICKYIL